jgi:hypothetical protein
MRINFRETSEKYLNVKLRENPSFLSRVFPPEKKDGWTDMQTDRHEEAYEAFLL